MNKFYVPKECIKGSKEKIAAGNVHTDYRQNNHARKNHGYQQFH
ncbi:unnamed protein product [marine sediment metagenome]|uniref:Uncharacterized protein n=1 Tax=marine sediment metagenome TaxID=412755 RepID=X1L477_9ZZZZ